ncbi:hypothetical protein [Pseudonocardia endophytica]|nr:hypothetical protein [Pseudonocardia endophytica]
MSETPDTMTVDGHTFRVTRRPGVLGQYDFDWLTGPSEGYGFTASSCGGEAMSRTDLEESIRSFLVQVDPATGYIE